MSKRSRPLDGKSLGAMFPYDQSQPLANRRDRGRARDRQCLLYGCSTWPRLSGQARTSRLLAGRRDRGWRIDRIGIKCALAGDIGGRGRNRRRQCHDRQGRPLSSSLAWLTRVRLSSPLGWSSAGSVAHSSSRTCSRYLGSWQQARWSGHGRSRRGPSYQPCAAQQRPLWTCGGFGLRRACLASSPSRPW